MIIHIHTQKQQHTEAAAHLTHLLHNESPPGLRRPPESCPPSPGGSSSASRLSAGAALARAGSVACYAAGVLLAAFAALVALPSQAQAQTEVWSGTLTVRNNSGTLGCSNGFANNFCSVHLSDDDFTHASTDYAITLVFLRTSGRLEFNLDTDLTTASQSLTLNVDGTAFAFEDADTKGTNSRSWNGSGLSWSVGDSVSLTLTEPADAPDPPTDLTANAKGETQVDLSWTAPADNGGEAISGYKVEVSANGTTAWSDLAADTASTDTTYSHTGLAAGNTRHYRVSAINSVDSGDASGVAGATTAAANVLVSNTGRSVDPAIAAGVATGDEDKTHSQGFDTGPNPGGYSLASVGVYVTRPSLEAGEAFTVHIYTAASNGTLDTLQHTLTSPASYTDNAVNTFTAPAGATLDASTDYFVVFEGTANAALDFVLGVTATNSQDRGTRAGWGIENARRFNSVTSNSGASFQISVNGTAIPTPMPSNSGLVPTGLTLGDTFRLLFLSSTRRTASASGIGTYNTHVQTAAAAGHTAIQAYSAGFRAVGCTSSQDANVNTRTLYTTSDQGVPIHWLNGAKAADDYADFYDGDWDEEAALKDESGTAAATTGNYPWTGCDHDGTELSGDALGSGSPVLGAPDSSFGTDGPISSSFADQPSETRPMYGLSELFAVAAAVVANNAPTFLSSTAARSVAENTAAGQDIGAVLTATDSDGDTLTYTLEGTDAASFALDTTTTAGSARIRTKMDVTYNHEAKSTYTVVVKADDGNGGTATVTVTITVTDVTEPPAQPAVPTVTTVSGSSDKLEVDWQAPANTGPDIDSYDLRYQKTTESTWANGPQGEPPFGTGGNVFLTGLDAGTAYRVQVRATNAEGDSGWSPSGTGTTDAAGNTAATGNPEISGTAQVGMTLEAAPGDLADADGLTGASYSYQWRRAGADGLDIPGATSSDYTLTPADNGKEIKVWADFTDDGGTAERRISVATLPVAPAAAACPSDAATVWCATLTVGHRLDDYDGDMGVAEAGYDARSGNTAYGSVSPATFRHLGVDYTVTSLHGGGTQDLYFATTPNLPADGAGLTVHVQKYVGELDVPLAEGVFQSDSSWFFQGALNTSASSGDTLSDMPLIHAPFARDQVVPHPPDLGTEVAVRLSYASTLPPGQTAVFFGASSYTASEGGAPATVAVELSPAPTAPVTIPLTPSRRGGATAGDYSGVPPSVTFQAGQTRLTFTVTATDDSVDDDGESVRIGFGTLPDGFVAGARPTATVALADNDGPVTEVFFDGAADLTVKEGNVTRVSVYLSEPARATVTIPLTRTHRGGATAADYSGVPASVTFRFRERRKQFTLRTTDDDDNDDNESLRIGFGPLPAGIRASTASHRPPTRTVHIEDDDGVDHWNVWFGAEAYTAAEGGAAARVSIHLDAPVEIAPLDVRLTLRYGGGATAADHRSIPAVVTFGLGERTKTITVTATDDSADDDGESVALWFGNPPNGRVSIGDGPITATVALEDNDGVEPVTVAFGAATYRATEGGSDATVRVELDTAPGRSVTVPLTRTHRGGATADDYSGIPETVTFGASQTARTFTVTATDDGVDDGGESVSIGFGPLPAGVSAGSPAAAAVTLADDSQLRSVVVNFGTSTSVVPKVREGVRSRFTLSLDSIPLRPVTIPLEVTHRGGATEADYEGLPASVTFGPNERQADFILRAVLDQQDETGEGLRIDFGPLPPGVRKGTWGPYETVEFVDTDPAAQASPSVAGPLLTLGYPGPLDAGSQPAPRDFVVAAEAPGRARAMLAVTAVAVRGSAVVLELDRPVTPDETVTLTYLAAAMHPIRDAAGLPAAPLADEPVRNDTGAPGPLPKAELPPGGMIPAALAVLLEDTPGDAGAERLDLSSRNLTDITALAGRTDLRELYLRDNAIADLSPLAGLTGLRVLDLRDNAITDLSPLAGLTGLQALDLAGNQITDLWPLAGLTALQRLDLAHNRIADLATLAELNGLRALDLAGNRIADLWPLAGLTALERLNLADNRIGHLATLAELTGLQVLDLAGNRIAGLWPLAGLAALERLNLSDNRIVDVSTLTGVGGLEVLLLDRNQVADVQALSQLAGLANLGLSDNRIADIGLLAELDRLLRLDLSGNAVADVAALGDVSRLVWLRLPGNPVSSAAPLERLEQLRWLWLDPGPAPGIETSVPPAEQGVAPLWIERTPAR